MTIKKMCESVNVNIYKVLILMAALLSYRMTYSSGIESFLPSLINIKPEIQMRSTSSRDTKNNILNSKNFSFMILTQPCGECSGFLIVVTVQSFVANYDSRKAIRETWGKQSNCIKIVFVIGTTYDNSVMKKISEESVVHNDIVQGNLEDTHGSLPYKHIMALKWANQYCKAAKYVIKTDADIIVRLDKLYKLLENNTWGARGLIAGNIEKHEIVLRNRNNNMKSRIVSKKEYKEQFYPTYCGGQFIIYSANVIPRLLEASTKIPYFKIEDIYVTGILAEHLGGIRHVNLVPDWYLSRATLANLTGYDVNNCVFGPYSLTSKEIREIWDVIVKAERTQTQNRLKDVTFRRYNPF